MTAQPLALPYATSSVFDASATTTRGTSARFLAGLAAMTRWARQLLRSLAAADNIHHRDNRGCMSLSGRSLRRIDHAPGGIRHFGERRGHKCRDLPPPVSATVLVSAVRRIPSNRGRSSVVRLIANNQH